MCIVAVHGFQEDNAQKVCAWIVFDMVYEYYLGEHQVEMMGNSTIDFGFSFV